MDIPAWFETARPILIAFGLKVLGAIAAYIVGRMLIGFGSRLVMRVLEQQHVDTTVTRYVGSIIGVALNIILVVAILGYFGVETTSFAALVAALGIAIGAAWGGLLSNFAAGAFILVLRPFKVGDYVVAGDVEGIVRMIGLFSTTIDAPDNVQTLVGNAKIMNGTIKNFSSNPYRRVELLAQIDHSVLLAGLLRHQPHDPRNVRCGRLSGGGGACPHAAAGGVGIARRQLASAGATAAPSVPRVRGLVRRVSTVGAGVIARAWLREHGAVAIAQSNLLRDFRADTRRRAWRVPAVPRPGPGMSSSPPCSRRIR